MAAHIEAERKEKMNADSLRPGCFSEFVGQHTAVGVLRTAVLAARQRNETPAHILLSGPPGLGKTSLAGIVAREMDGTLHTLAGPSVEQRHIFPLLRGLKAGDAVFVDEVHSLSPAIEELLYPPLEDFELHLVFGRNVRRVPLQKFTFIGATTKPALVSSPLRSRFGLALRLDYYWPSELAEIIRRSAGILNIEIAHDAAAAVAAASRGTPRIANSYLRIARDVAQVRGLKIISCDVVRATLASLGIDSRGLDRTDRAILQTLVRAGRAVGLQGLAVSVSESEETIAEVHEPYLLQQGLVCRTQRGRVATQLGHAALGN